MKFEDVSMGSLFYDDHGYLYRKDGKFLGTLLDKVPNTNALEFFSLDEEVLLHHSGCAEKMPEDYLQNSPFQEIPLGPPQPCVLPYPEPTVQEKPACISCGDMGEYINGNHYEYCSNCRKRPAVRKSLSDAERGEALRHGSPRFGSRNHQRQAAPIQTERFVAHEASRASSEGTSGLEAVAAEPRVSDKGLGPFAHDR